MKPARLSLILFTLSALAQAASLYDTAVLASNPLAYWKLNESSGTSATDSSGNGNHGTYQGGVTLGSAGPIAGDSAATFDGSTGYVSLPGTWGGGSAVTVEAWVLVAASTGDFQAIVSPTNSSFVHFQMHTLGNDVVYVNSGSEVDLPILSPTPFGTWRHVAITASSGSESLYVNGVSVGSATTAFTTVTPTTSGDLRIGSGYLSSRFFNGQVADVAIYNTALSAGDIQAHYNASFAPEPGTIVLIGAGLLGLVAARRRR